MSLPVNYEPVTARQKMEPHSTRRHGISKYNHEGYADPTAHAALSKIEKWHPIVYICSPYQDNPHINIMRTRKYCKFAVDRGRLPLAPHLYFPQFMSDADEREKAMSMYLELMRFCGEVWVFGDKVTEGMSMEIAHAEILRKKIRYMEKNV